LVRASIMRPIWKGICGRLERFGRRRMLTRSNDEWIEEKE
jgi:hypothetical protein